MKLNNGKMQLHLEISEDAYWSLTSIAAEDRMHIEEWLESYLDEHCIEPSSIKESVYKSQSLRPEAAYVARLLIADHGLDLVNLCNLLAQISARQDSIQGVKEITLNSNREA